MTILDLVTVATVRAFRGWSADATQDAVLGSLITDISARFEGELCGRLLASEARTVQLNVRPDQSHFQLMAWPVDSGEAFTIVNDYERAFTGDAVAAGDIYTQYNIGAIHIETGLQQGLGALQVTYTGGIGATAAAVESGYPDIADAVKRQVVYEYERKDSLGQTTQTFGQSGNQKSWADAGGWLPEVREVIKRYKHTVIC